MPRTTVFLLLDGVPLREVGAPSIALCALAAAPDGTLAAVGTRRVACADERAWTGLLRELRAGGAVGDPLLVCCDGAPAVVRAVEAVFPHAAVQYSIPHRLAALRRIVDDRRSVGCVAEARRIFQAADREAAAARFRAWRARWLARGERAPHDLEEDLARCLAFYRLPQHLRARARSVTAVRHAMRRAQSPGAAQRPLPRPEPPHKPVPEPLSPSRPEPAPAEAPVGAIILGGAQGSSGLSRPRRTAAVRLWAAAGTAALIATAGAPYLPGLARRPSGAAELATASSAAAVAPMAPAPVAGEALHQEDRALASAPASAHQEDRALASAPASAHGDAGTADRAAAQALAPFPARGERTRGVNLVLTATGRSWLRVTVDGVRVFEDVVRAGEIRQWTARRMIQVRAGNAGAVDLTVNGRRLGVPGRVGQIASLAFTPSGARP
ncbi:MAG: DUF4115 domain-containing protein [Armatimonadota bacterium]|nr:DUF4115 domain-containing protein [Armatimonadota bacterium]MDR7533104.1 DUF4115 domain-containing protein [Armatimonadota bacterium]